MIRMSARVLAGLAAGLALAWLAPARAEEEKADVQAQVRELIAQFEGGGMQNQRRALEAKTKVVKIGAPAVPQLVQATSDKSPWIRLWSLASLCDIGDKRAIEPALRLMEDESTVVREVAIWNGSRFAGDDARIAEAVLKHMRDPAPRARGWARRAIVERKISGAQPKLEAMLTDASPEARLDIFIALAMVQGKPIPDFARETIQKGAAPAVLAAAYRALQQGPPDMAAAETFFTALDHPNDEVKDAAVQGLEWALKAGSEEPEEGEGAKPLLSPADQKKIQNVLEQRLPAFIRSGFAPLRAHTLYLLAASQKEALLPEIQKALKEPEAIVRAHAIRALARAGVRGKPMIEPALAALSDPDTDVRRAAYLAIVWATDRRVVLPFRPDAAEADRAPQAAKIREACKQFMD